ncbi:DEAD/DEAH box helicase [Labrys sp. 22185]|uniref:DEAD/DEAH box helicase n=1 Tax=Labrys sp. 22185 TaxID=3453888 RepID=UPI003F82878C
MAIMKRPLFQARIADLEALFERSRADREALEGLLHELGFRSVDRAQVLKKKVVQALGVLPKEKKGLKATKPARTQSASSPRQQPNQQTKEASPVRQTEPAKIAKITRPPEIEPEVIVRPAFMPAPRASRRQAAAYADQPADILAAWTALEVLSPFTYSKPSDLVDGDERRVARFADQLFMPWINGGDKAKPGTQLCYHIVLGAIRMEEATKALLEVYVDDELDRRTESGFAGIATITIDKFGRPIPEKAAAVSSFAWGLPLALRDGLKRLQEWPTVERKLTDMVDEQIRRQDSEGNLLPLDPAAIERVYKLLVERLELPAHMMEAPSFALRHYHFFKAIEPPDPPLLGSFYLGDLAAARSVMAEKMHRNLARYLGLEKPLSWADILQDNRTLAEAVAPGRTPLGRWPGEGRHSLALLQQAAVNLAVSNDPDATLLPVNGPPGTGKTTLLRDLVASLVVGRAEAMCAFDDPEEAFSHVGQTKRSGMGFSHIYQPDKRLLGFEMLVASSNNRAVENVSSELPRLKAIAKDAPNLRYFKTVSDNIDGKEETWGLIAAVLGNSSNRYKFKEAFWGNADHGLRSYLSEASGQPQWMEEVDPKTQKVLRKRKPEVVSKESPPTSHDAALKKWRSARKAFRQAIAEARAYRLLLEEARVNAGSIGAKAAAVRAREQDKRAAEQAVADAEDEFSELQAQIISARAAEQRARQQSNEHQRSAPKLMARLVGGTTARTWSEKKANIDRDLDQAVRHQQAISAFLSAAFTKREAERGRLVIAAARLDEATSVFTSAEQQVEVLRTRCGSRAVDRAFFGREPAEMHTTSPWYDDQAHRDRDRVFECAMQVHRAFIGAAAKPIRNNLDVLFKAFFGRSGWSPRMAPVMPGLWSTLFMVVPVISTTFASIERMIGYLPPGALGWLLIDEAGQAVPQAAVGAIMRTQRAIVVGDPRQVEPVTSLPTQLAETICEEFSVNPDKWNAPEASVQTVVDATSSRGTKFGSNDNQINVGLPLLVHRRCADPMFSISNEIAYDGLMVKATPDRGSMIRDVLGPSHWIDIKPTRTEDKWSEAEGQAIVDLLRRLGEAGVPELDIYIISPFRIVAQRLRERIGASGVLKPWTDKAWEWTRDRVGTVHTVQGREADSVIFVLGAPLPAQNGARHWAGSSVNLLNVAVTRAQENLYVVGARSAWTNAGCFRTLISNIQPLLPTVGRPN